MADERWASALRGEAVVVEELWQRRRLRYAGRYGLPDASARLCRVGPDSAGFEAAKRKAGTSVVMSTGRVLLADAQREITGDPPASASDAFRQC